MNALKLRLKLIRPYKLDDCAKCARLKGENVVNVDAKISFPAVDPLFDTDASQDFVPLK